MPAHPAIARLFSGAAGAPRRVAGGQALYETGAPADALFLVTAGAFAVFRSVDGVRTLLGIVRPGEIIGESAVLAATPRTATVVALRDSEALTISAEAFFRAGRRRPEVLTEIARLLIERARSVGAPKRYEPPKVIAIAALVASVDAKALTRRLTLAFEAQGRSVATLYATAVDEPASWWSTVEQDHDVVLCAIEHDEQAWGAACRRQADRMMMVGRGGETPPSECGLCASEPLQASALIDLVLLHRGQRPTGTAAWTAATAPARVYHLLGDDDCTRLARALLGTGVALALSGGGARAFAHIGAVRALRRAGVIIDAVCGTSMGAIVAGGVALGWDDGEMDERVRRAFVTTNPLDDIALPLVAMTRGAKVERRLREHFGEWAIEDLPLPFFCVSADLGTGTHVAHRAGNLARALRASISLPGVLPPLTDGSQVLVDGGTLLNLPTGLLRADHDGTVVAVDVSRSKGLRPEDVARPSPLIAWLWSGAWRRGPPLVSILMRSATIAAEPQLRAAKAAADLYVMPEVADIEIRNWRAFDRAVKAGDEAMSRALDDLDRPVAELRRHREAAAAMPM